MYAIRDNRKVENNCAYKHFETRKRMEIDINYEKSVLQSNSFFLTNVNFLAFFRLKMIFYMRFFDI